MPNPQGPDPSSEELEGNQGGRSFPDAVKKWEDAVAAAFGALAAGEKALGEQHLRQALGVVVITVAAVLALHLYKNRRNNNSLKSPFGTALAFTPALALAAIGLALTLIPEATRSVAACCPQPTPPTSTSTSPSPTPPTPSPDPTTPSPSPPPRPSPSPQPSALRYEATIPDVNSLDGLDLDVFSGAVPNITQDEFTYDLRVSDEGTFSVYSATLNGNIVVSTDQASPNLSSCTGDLLEHPDGEYNSLHNIQSNETLWLCVESSEKHVAAIHILSLTHTGNGHYASADAEIVVWPDSALNRS